MQSWEQGPGDLEHQKGLAQNKRMPSTPTSPAVTQQGGVGEPRGNLLLNGQPITPFKSPCRMAHAVSGILSDCQLAAVDLVRSHPTAGLLAPPPFRRWDRGGCESLSTEPEDLGQERWGSMTAMSIHRHVTI